MHRVFNHQVLFHLGWVAAVFFMASGMGQMALACIAIVIASHLAVVAAPQKEALFLAFVMLAGIALIALMLIGGKLSLLTPPAEHGSVIAWTVGMWVLFATALNSGFSWIKHSWWMAAAAGMVIGGMTYFTLSALDLIAGGLTPLAAFCLGWVLLVPVIALVADTIIDSAWLEPSAERNPVDARLKVMEPEYNQR